MLVIDDSEADARLSIMELKYAGYDIEYQVVYKKDDIINAFKNFTWDIITCDYNMPHLNGIEVLELYKKFGIDAPFITISGSIGDDLAVDIIKRGASDYVLKNNLKRLGAVIERELRGVETRKNMLTTTEASDPKLFNELKHWAMEKITELKTVNDELRAENDRLRELISNANVPRIKLLSE